MSVKRAPSDSRCSKPENAPYNWLIRIDDSHASVVRFDKHFSSMVPSVRAMLEGELEDLFEAAACGELQESSDLYQPLKPISSDPEIWELRYKGSMHYRFYHGEPPDDPRSLVRLHKHIKDSARQQQAEIEFAISRYYN